MRKRIAGATTLTIVLLVGLYFAMMSLQGIMGGNQFLPSFSDMTTSAADGNILSRMLWFLGDMTECNFYKSVPASIGILLLGIISYLMEKNGKAFLGVKALGGSGKFVQVLCTSLLSLIISNFVYFDIGFKATFWTPTFVPFVSSAASIILVFGMETRKLLTAGILAGFGTWPLCHFSQYITDPLGLPGFSGSAVAMGISTLIMIELCRLMPWMKPQPASQSTDSPAQPPKPFEGNALFIRRLLGDPGELMFWGTPLTTIGLWIGGILGWIMNPNSIMYATGRFPMLICAATATTAVAIFVYYPKYVKEGFAFTFVCPVVVGAIINTYTPTALGLVLTIAVAMIVPAIVHFLLEKVSVTQRWHPCPLALIALGLVSGLWSFAMMYIPGLIVVA